MTTVLAWTAALGVCLAAVLFGQTARTARRRRSRRSGSCRVGLVLSLSGPWVAVAVGAGVGALTSAWLTAAAVAAAATLAVALAGLVLVPR